MKRVSELYLVACQTDTFTQHVLEFFRIDGDGPTALNRAQAIATEARMLGKTVRSAIERHKEGEEE